MGKENRDMTGCYHVNRRGYECKSRTKAHNIAVNMARAFSNMYPKDTWDVKQSNGFVTDVFIAGKPVDEQANTIEHEGY